MNDIYYTIFTHLSIKDIVMCSIVCKKFYSITNYNILWENIYKKNFKGYIFKNTYFETCKLWTVMNKIKNKIKYKCSCLDLYNLKILDSTHNQLTTIPTELGQLNALQTLYLHNNQLTIRSAVPTELKRLNNLQIKF